MKITKLQLKQIIKEEINKYTDYYEQGSLDRSYDNLLDELKPLLEALAAAIVTEYEGKEGFDMAEAKGTIAREVKAVLDGILEDLLPELFPGEEEEEWEGFTKK